MFIGTKQQTETTEELDENISVKMWAIELMLQTYLSTKTVQQDSDKQLTKEEIVKILDFSRMLQNYVSFDILPEELDDEL